MKPEDIEQKEFVVAGRGYVREEVQAFLRAIATDVRGYQARIAELEAKLLTLSAPDRGALLQMLGNEVAMVLDAADAAGDQIRARANRDVDAVRQKATGLMSSIEQMKDLFAMMAADVQKGIDQIGVEPDAQKGIDQIGVEPDVQTDAAGTAHEPTIIRRPTHDATHVRIHSQERIVRPEGVPEGVPEPL